MTWLPLKRYNDANQRSLDCSNRPMSASSTVPLSSTDELLYFDVALKKGWIRPATQDRARQMCEKILVAALKLFARHRELQCT